MVKRRHTSARVADTEHALPNFVDQKHGSGLNGHNAAGQLTPYTVRRLRARPTHITSVIDADACAHAQLLAVLCHHEVPFTRRYVQCVSVNCTVLQFAEDGCIPRA